MRQEASPDLSPTLTAALATVERHGPLTPSELAEVERIKRPTATRIAASLEADELIVRAPDPERRQGVAPQHQPARPRTAAQAPQA